MLKEKCKGSGKFELILKGSGVFRNFSDPRIIWTGIEQSEKLVYLNEIIINGLKGLNIKLEDRPFNPHLTIGRIKHLNENETLRVLIEQFKNSELQIIPVYEVILSKVSFFIQDLCINPYRDLIWCDNSILVCDSHLLPFIHLTFSFLLYLVTC